MSTEETADRTGVVVNLNTQPLSEGKCDAELMSA